jgi:N-acyl-phosphatidylethanolamine-hydrolysing phospholipase D
MNSPQKIRYTASISEPTSSPSPQDVRERRHHLGNGQGFINPWPSARDMSGPKIGGLLLWYSID